MNKKEYMLSRDIGNWLYYAKFELGMAENDATVMWNNEHNIGKYLICESREDAATRLFIRNVTNPIIDVAQKAGWWNVFTVTKNPTQKGLWLAEVVEYRLDKNGYLNLEVETILPIDDVKFSKLFESDNGTWNSVAWWLMMVRSNAFLDEYCFHHVSIHEPNLAALVKRFPELDGLMGSEIGKVMLQKYLRNETTLEEIEECLNTLTDWEQLLSDIQKAVAYHTVEKTYGEKYPIFSKKVSNNVIKGGCISLCDVELYLQRQLDFYTELVNQDKIKAIDGNYMDKVETALTYRKLQKDAEKQARKEKRKNKA